MKKKITDLYRAWRKANGNSKPNRAIVKMCWLDGENTDKGWQQDIIALKDYDINPPRDDDSILFYVRGLKGLMSLMSPNSGADFVVLDVINFYKA